MKTSFKLCGASRIGQSHISGGSPCQDSHAFYEGAGFVVAAVADGLGSSKHSDIASDMAAKGAVGYCARELRGDMPDGAILKIIKAAFDEVNFAVKRRAGDHPDDYDTTLTLAVFTNGRVLFGHAGDSGIIALRRDGVFERVTEPQNGDGVGKERPVFPLAAEARWVFGAYQHMAKALFLMTDGVWKRVVPPLLERQKYELDHAYLYYLFDNLNRIREPDARRAWIVNEVDAIAPSLVDYDDKTLAIVLDDGGPLRPQKSEYYKYPSDELWKKLKERQEKELYPYRAVTQSPPAPPQRPRQWNASPQPAPPGNGEYVSYSYAARENAAARNRINRMSCILQGLTIFSVAELLTIVMLVFALITKDKELSSVKTPSSLPTVTATPTPEPTPTDTPLPKLTSPTLTSPAPTSPTTPPPEQPTESETPNPEDTANPTDSGDESPAE
ncbi:MAG: protein phosphatase 2C domain-containing protein [Oscillospiraceae bacterium]|jgi:hypothetical protein|nr:protein phosphatase 2C domain-containing protein [Oscillospiraceae bacterium]